jgi:hypothetical protein
VKTEEQAKETARSSMTPDEAYDQATFYDTPLTNELYLLVLPFVWHEMEKEIVLLAAMSASQDATPMTRDEYRQGVERLGGLKGNRRKKELKKRLPTLAEPRHQVWHCVAGSLHRFAAKTWPATGLTR